MGRFMEFTVFDECDGDVSLPCSLEATTGSSTEPNESKEHTYTVFI
jgi:hypothetical protein